MQSSEHIPPIILKFCTIYNARSLLPKFDELLISVDNYQPDIVCITEFWLCSDIHDSELLLPGYQCLRYDRNRHGGGVFMYVLHKYIVKQLSSHPSLELLTVIVHCRKRRLCVSSFYRPPSSSVDVLHSLHSYLESINIPQFFSFVLIGDFNINFWTGLILPFLVLIIFFLLFV